MEWLKQLKIKFRAWKEERELQAALRRQKVQARLDELIAIENEKSIIRVKKRKLEKLKEKGRPKVSKSFRPNYFGSGFNIGKEEKVDYLKNFK